MNLPTPSLTTENNVTTISAVCKSLAEALIDDPFYQAVTVDYAGDAEQRQHILAQYCVLAIDEAKAIGEVQFAGSNGAAIWLTNESTKNDKVLHSTIRTEGLSKLLGPVGFDHYLRISECMEKQVPENLSGAWYLSIVGVKSAARGQGLGHDVITKTLTRADKQGVICTLETFNPLFYRRLGFVNEVKCFEEVTERYYWLMSRDAVK